MPLSTNRLRNEIFARLDDQLYDWLRQSAEAQALPVSVLFGLCDKKRSRGVSTRRTSAWGGAGRQFFLHKIRKENSHAHEDANGDSNPSLR
jgi:hypothetical protein